MASPEGEAVKVLVSVRGLTGASWRAALLLRIMPQCCDTDDQTSAELLIAGANPCRPPIEDERRCNTAPNNGLGA